MKLVKTIILFWVLLSIHWALADQAYKSTETIFSSQSYVDIEKCVATNQGPNCIGETQINRITLQPTNGEMEVHTIHGIDKANKATKLLDAPVTLSRSLVLDIPEQGVQRLLIKAIAKSEMAKFEIKLSTSGMAVFDFEKYESPHTQNEWVVSQDLPGYQAKAIRVKNTAKVGARITKLLVLFENGKLLPVIFSTGREALFENESYTNKDLKDFEFTKQARFKSGEEKVFPIENFGSIQSIQVVADSSSSDDPVAQFQLGLIPAETYGQTKTKMAFDYSRDEGEPNKISWSLLSKEINGKKLIIKNENGPGRITWVEAKYVGQKDPVRISNSYVTKGASQKRGRYAHRGRMDGSYIWFIKLSADAAEITLDLDSSKKLESLTVFGDSWVNDKSDFNIGLTLIGKMPASETLTIPSMDDKEWLSKEQVWQASESDQIVNGQSIQIRALAPNIEVRKALVVYVNGQVQDLLKSIPYEVDPSPPSESTAQKLSGDKKNSMFFSKDGEVLTYPLMSTAQIKKVIVQAGVMAGDMANLTLKVLDERGEDKAKLCFDSSGKFYRSYVTFQKRLADMTKNLCQFGGVKNEYYQIHQNIICINGEFQNLDKVAATEPYQTDSTDCYPEPTQFPKTPVACTGVNVQGNIVNLFNGEEVDKQDESLLDEGQKIELSKKCPWDQGGTNIYWSVFRHKCNNQGEVVKIDTQPDGRQGRFIQEGQACPAPRSCLSTNYPSIGEQSQVAHSRSWPEVTSETQYYNAKNCEYDFGVMKEIRQVNLIHTCENGSIKSGATQAVAGQLVDTCWQPIDPKTGRELGQCGLNPHLNQKPADAGKFNSGCLPMPDGQPLTAWVTLPGGHNLTFNQFLNSGTDVYPGTTKRYFNFEQSNEYVFVRLYVSADDKPNEWGQRGLVSDKTPVRIKECYILEGNEWKLSEECQVQVSNYSPSGCSVKGMTNIESWLSQNQFRFTQNGFDRTIPSSVINGKEDYSISADQTLAIPKSGSQSMCSLTIEFDKYTCRDGQVLPVEIDKEESYKFFSQYGQLPAKHADCRPPSETQCTNVNTEDGQMNVDHRGFAYVVTKYKEATDCEEGEKTVEYLQCYDTQMGQPIESHSRRPVQVTPLHAGLGASHPNCKPADQTRCNNVTTQNGSESVEHGDYAWVEIKNVPAELCSAGEKIYSIRQCWDRSMSIPEQSLGEEYRDQIIPLPAQLELNHPDCRPAYQTQCSNVNTPEGLVTVAHKQKSWVITEDIAATDCTDGRLVYSYLECYDRQMVRPAEIIPGSEDQVSARPSTYDSSDPICRPAHETRCESKLDKFTNQIVVLEHGQTTDIVIEYVPRGRCTPGRQVKRRFTCNNKAYQPEGPRVPQEIPAEFAPTSAQCRPEPVQPVIPDRDPVVTCGFKKIFEDDLATGQASTKTLTVGRHQLTWFNVKKCQRIEATVVCRANGTAKVNKQSRSVNNMNGARKQICEAANAITDEVGNQLDKVLPGLGDIVKPDRGRREDGRRSGPSIPKFGG